MMNFKKGDIVEVIKRDYSGDKTYEVGSRWEVIREDEKNGGYTDDILYVKDDTRHGETVALYTSCVKKVEEDRSTYNKLLTFVNEHDIPISTVNEVVKHLDKIEKLDVDIENTKKLWKQHEDEAQRMYDKLSKLKIERYELKNKTEKGYK